MLALRGELHEGGLNSHRVALGYYAEYCAANVTAAWLKIERGSSPECTSRVLAESLELHGLARAQVSRYLELVNPQLSRMR